MISRLRGTVISISTQQLVLDVHGVGYTVSIFNERLFSVEQQIDVQIYYHWNQENGPQLYGFTTIFEKSVFTKIISCTGCGPKIGLAVLAHMSPEEFVSAIALSDAKSLSRVSGIGPKKAELMVMQLKDKVSELTMQGSVGKNSNLSAINSLSQTLQALDYKQAEISAALDFISKNGSLNDQPVNELVRKSLAFLAKRI